MFSYLLQSSRNNPKNCTTCTCGSTTWKNGKQLWPAGIDREAIGYHLIRRFWGNGYATEAATAFKEMAFDNNLAGSIISIIDLENRSSQKVAQRNGMSRVRKTKFIGMDVFIYRIEREAYLKPGR